MEEILPMAELEDSLKNHIPQQQYRDLYNLAETRLPPSCDLQPRLFTDHMTHSSSYDSKIAIASSSKDKAFNKLQDMDTDELPRLCQYKAATRQPTLHHKITLLLILIGFLLSIFTGTWIHFLATCQKIPTFNTARIAIVVALMAAFNSGFFLLQTSIAGDVVLLVVLMIYHSQKFDSVWWGDIYDAWVLVLTYMTRCGGLILLLTCIMWQWMCIYDAETSPTSLHPVTGDMEIVVRADKVIISIATCIVFKVFFYVSLEILRVLIVCGTDFVCVKSPDSPHGQTELEMLEEV